MKLVTYALQDIRRQLSINNAEGTTPRLTWEPFLDTRERDLRVISHSQVDSVATSMNASGYVLV